MSSIGKGMGLMFGVVIACIIMGVMLMGVNKVAMPCPSCHGTGNCMWCGGTGEGKLWGECMNCDGRKKCPTCGGSGFKWK